jgi:hypothetical protein
MNMICVRVETAGSHHLQVGPSISPAKKVGAWITGICFLFFVAVLLIFEILHRKRHEKALT